MKENLIFEDSFATLEQASFCDVPGYLVLRLRTGAESWAELDPNAAREVGIRLSTATKAIEEAVQADRVYCLSFCELDRNLHFHLFPRTSALLTEYWQDTGAGSEPINGPLLFEWARQRYPDGSRMPSHFPSISTVLERLRALIG